MTPARLRELFAWARSAGWRPKYPLNRRDGLFSWVDQPKDSTTRRWPVGATTVTVDGWYDGSSGATVTVYRMTQAGWVSDARFVTGSGQRAVDVLAGMFLVPRRFAAAYRDGLRAAADCLPVSDLAVVAWLAERRLGEGTSPVAVLNGARSTIRQQASTATGS